MPQTKDYVKYGSKLGRQMFVAYPFRYVYSADGECIEDEEFEKGRTFPNAGLAKAWLRKRLPELGVEWCAFIERGSYEDCSFSDPGYGYIRDLSWERDDQWTINVWRTADGDVEFDD